MAQDTTAEDPIEIQPRISQELSDLADAALEGALAIARNEVDGSEHVRFAIIETVILLPSFARIPKVFRLCSKAP